MANSGEVATLEAYGALRDMVASTALADLSGQTWVVTAERIHAVRFSGVPVGAVGGIAMDDLTLESLTLLPIGGANGDGCVSGADYTVWADNLDNGGGPGGKTWHDGDWTGEGYVTGADFTDWTDHFGEAARRRQCRSR